MTPNQPVIIQIGCVTILLLVAITINSVFENDHISELDKKIDSLNQKLQGNESTTALTYGTLVQTGIYDGTIKMLVTDNKTNTGTLIVAKNAVATDNFSIDKGECNFTIDYYVVNFTLIDEHVTSGVCDPYEVNVLAEGYLLTEGTTLH